MIQLGRNTGKLHAQAMHIVFTLKVGDSCAIAMPRESPETLKKYLGVFKDNGLLVQVKNATKKVNGVKIFTGYIITRI